jgi:hypothetical protein
VCVCVRVDGRVTLHCKTISVCYLLMFDEVKIANNSTLFLKATTSVFLLELH